MKSILQNVKTGEVTMEEIPPPKVRPGFVLVKNVCSLVSAGTEKTVLEFSRASYLDKARKRPDLFRKVLNKVKHEGILKTWESVNNLMEKPLQLGYSSAGIVMEKGLDVTDIQVGQKVACAGYLYATHSEVVSVPRNLIVPLPDGVSFEEASFVTLGAIAMQGIRLAGLELGEQVVVYGLGLVGMITVQLAIAAGCKVIGVDIDPKKIEKVREYGALGVPAGEDMAAKILNFTKDCGADKVLLCAATRSNEPVEKIPEFTRQKGILVVVGEVSLNLPRRLYYDKEIDVRISRSYGPGRYDMSYEEGGVDYPYAYVRWTENRNMEAVLDLIAGKKLDFISLITHRFKIEEAGSAYQLMEGKINEPYLGIVIQYKEALAQPEKKISDTVSYHSGFKKKTGNLYFGVIGAGQFARALLLPAFHSQKGVVFKKICTLSGVSAAVAAKKFKASEATSSADSVFKDTQIDGLLLATRHDSHARYVMMGLENKMA
ncbi:MAG: zinc-binding dehydrogenase, partial [Candidatus Aureabacteria bacterium]|nr:zinc-binding dehydrogenase [Candidatus Auribacterota bacterium]